MFPAQYLQITRASQTHTDFGQAQKPNQIRE